MEYQLRRYRIAPGKLDEFIGVWKAGVVPLRERFGFQVHGAWSIELVGFDAADAAYYASEERRRLSPDPAEHIANIVTASAHRVV